MRRKRSQKESMDESFSARLVAGFGMLHESHPDEPVDEDFDGPIDEPSETFDVIDRRSLEN
jgi:hypothetical protein